MRDFYLQCHCVKIWAIYLALLAFSRSGATLSTEQHLKLRLQTLTEIQLYQWLYTSQIHAYLTSASGVNSSWYLMHEKWWVTSVQWMLLLFLFLLIIFLFFLPVPLTSWRWLIINKFPQQIIIWIKSMGPFKDTNNNIIHFYAAVNHIIDLMRTLRGWHW